jgi:hypothetical protein
MESGSMSARIEQGLGIRKSKVKGRSRSFATLRMTTKEQGLGATG